MDWSKDLTGVETVANAALRDEAPSTMRETMAPYSPTGPNEDLAAAIGAFISAAQREVGSL
jgi:hypothetical protein